METFYGRVDRVVSEFPDLDHWTIFDLLTTEGDSYRVKANGFFPLGWEVSIVGKLEEDRGKATIKASEVTRTLPVDAESIGMYLSSLGSLELPQATAFASRLGVGAMNKLVANPNLLTQLNGLPSGEADAIAEEFIGQLAIFQAESELQRIGVPSKIRCRLFDNFGYDIKKILDTDPYQFTKASRVPFKTIDAAALTAGMPSDDPRRISALCAYAMEHIANTYGHTWATPELIARTIRKDMKLEVVDPEKTMARALDLGHLTKIGDGYALPGIAAAEDRIARQLITLKSPVKQPCRRPSNWDNLNHEQRQAVLMSCENRFGVLTGGPGCGKTFTLKAMMEAWNTEDILLCAPTGKASKKMQEATGRPAVTVHHLMNTLRFGKGPKRLGNIVVDEASMLNVEVFCEFLDLILANPESVQRMVLVGDSDQLPAIGAGRVLEDIIASGVFPVAKLLQVVRQGQDSMIAIAAANIRDGKPLPVTSGQKGGDFHVTYADTEKQTRLLTKALRERVPLMKKKNGTPYDPMRDVQVLVPQHDGELGTVKLNALLRDILNPRDVRLKKEFMRQSEVVFRQGDKILISKNNRESKVANGDIGYIKDIRGGKLVLELPDQTVEISQMDPTIQLGYAITVHKAQGSEAPMVISFFNDDIPDMLRVRNLLYTAVTRAREEFWLLGDEKVVNECIANNQPAQRQTLLQQYLTHHSTPQPEQEMGLEI